ncbi:ADP-glucose phosphorylase [Elaeis guineensis]|uniref:ADP-glucose phosphorylase n=1 Tax=Elaeis guineensis var. tenera TaxID=51953 RepID=A0A6I9SIA8_ELAGV|nr:ADP-glucose phosphorylase [Elaeis guineensis]
MSSSSSPSRISEIRRDAVFDRWVVFSPARARRPSDFKSHAPASNPNPNRNPNALPSCPFCIGRESECAPEIFRLPAGCGATWKIRVIENLFPALRRDVEPPVPGDTADAAWLVKLSLPGFGFHDVVIETPYHSMHLPDLSPQEAGEVLLAYKERILQFKRHGSIKYVQVFKNHGASAGASMSHSHSQIMGLPLIPPTVAARLNATKEWFERTGKCSLCEIRSEEILINETVHFFAIVPFAASYPFEIWIVPRHHSSHFHDIDSEKAADLGSLLKLMLRKLSKQLNDPPYNFMIHAAPLELAPSCLPYMHWFLQIVPQLNRLAGFEMASGCFINPVFPEDAAKVLREVDCSI